MDTTRIRVSEEIQLAERVQAAAAPEVLEIVRVV
jgi:hypothetical protein